jgi:hypothetical protein
MNGEHEKYYKLSNSGSADEDMLYSSGSDSGVRLTITEQPGRRREGSSMGRPATDYRSDASDDHSMALTASTRSTSDGRGEHALHFSSRETTLSYLDIREKLHDKYNFKRILRNRSYASHYEFFDTYYSASDVIGIANFYGIPPSSMILDEIVRYELDFSNYERVWERYKVWESLAVVRKYADILRPLV